jgi:hypothetical protein
MRDLIIIGELQVWPRDLGKMTWDEATSSVKKLGLGWRLPTIKEFKETLYPGRSGMLDIGRDYYWSSTENPYYSDLAWTFSLYAGYSSSYPKEHSYRVLAVRDFGGETALEILLKDF